MPDNNLSMYDTLQNLITVMQDDYIIQEDDDEIDAPVLISVFECVDYFLVSHNIGSIMVNDFITMLQGHTVLSEDILYMADMCYLHSYLFTSFIEYLNTIEFSYFIEEIECSCFL